MSNNSHCGPDIVKYFVVEPANDVVTGATGNFFVCSGTTFLKTISGCTDSVDFNGNTFYNNSDVFFNGVITACTGIHTSNIYGCSPITVHDELILLNKLTLSAVTQDDTLTQILGRDSSTGEVKYRSVESIITGATSQDTFVTGGTFNDTLNELTLKRNDSFNIVISGFSSGAQFGTTYFVAPEGNDLTGEYGNISKPFKTITGARNQLLVDSLSGQTLIYVFPGTYDETELQYPNGKMYLSPGSLIKPSAKINGVGAVMTAVNQGTKTFTFNGNWSSYLTIGKKFEAFGGSNSGTYTIVSATDVGGTTEIVVSEVIPSPSVGGSLRTNETIFLLGATPLNAPSGSTSNNFDLYGEGDIDIVKSLDDDWSKGVVTSFGSSEFYGEAVNWRMEKGVIMGSYDDSKMTFNGSNLELYGGSGYVTTVRDSSDTTFNFDRISGNGSYTFYVRYSSNPTFNGSCVVTANVIKSTNSSQTIGLQRMGPGGRVVINSPIVESETFTLNAAQNSGGEFILNGNIVATTANGSGVVTGLDFGTKANFTINGNITTDSNRAFLGFGTVNSSWYLNGNIESLSGSTNPILDLGTGSGSINLNGSIKNTDGGTTLDGISTGGVSIIVENLDVVADNETITSSSPQTVEILHSLSINNPLGSNITTTGLFNYTGTTNVGDLVIYNTPTNDNSLTQILARNTDGLIKYVDVNSIITGATTQDTFVTGFTYNDANTFTISRNDGVDLSVNMDTMSGLTINGGLLVTGTTNISGITSINSSLDVYNGTIGLRTNDYFLQGTSTGGTNVQLIGVYSNDEILIGNQGYTNRIMDDTIIKGELDILSGLTLSQTPTLNNSGTDILIRNSSTGEVEYRPVSGITPNTNTFVTGFTFNDSTYDLTISQNNGESDLVSNLAVLASDVYVVSGIYNPSTGIVTYTNSSGGTFQVSGFTTGMTDSYTTDAYISGSEIRFDNNIQGANYYNVDLNPLLSGKTDNTTFNTYTANTQTILDGKIDSANNVGGANEFFKDKSGTTLNFRTLSGGSNTTVSTVGNVVKVDVTIPTDSNTFVTGFTYDNINTFTISDNSGSTFNAIINVLSATTISATTYFGDGSNLTGISTDDNYVTGGTLNSGTLTLDRQNGSVTITGFTTDLDTFVTGGTYNPVTVNLDFSGNTGFSPFSVDVSALKDDTNTFVTGFTYNDNNTFTIFDNDGGSFPATINQVSGLTVNGTLSATTYFGDGSNLTGISTDDNYVTGGTFSTNTLTLNRQNGSVTITGFTSDSNTFVTGYTYNDANTFTISNNDGSNYSALINTMTGLTINGESTGTTLTVNGQSVFSGISTDVVQIYGSGSTTPIFRIQGSSGELFSVTDSLVGELFAVNDISGIPILQVHSDNRIILGDNLAPSLYSTAKVTATSGSLTSIYSVPLSAYTGAWFEYTAKGTTSLRAGNIASIFSGTSVNHNETTTTDIGDTSDLLLDVIISGTSATLTASATTSNWEIKTIIRSI